MKEETKQILAAVDAAPTLFREAGRLKKELDAGEESPSDLTKKQQFDEFSATLHLITQMIAAVPDPSIQKMLRIRAIIGIPWSRIRCQSGADSRSFCATYIDDHIVEILGEARIIHSIADKLLRGVEKED